MYQVVMVTEMLMYKKYGMSAECKRFFLVLNILWANFGALWNIFSCFPLLENDLIFSLNFIRSINLYCPVLLSILP